MIQIKLTKALSSLSNDLSFLWLTVTSSLTPQNPLCRIHSPLYITKEGTLTVNYMLCWTNHLSHCFKITSMI